MRINDDIKAHGHGKPPIVFHSPQLVKEYDYKRPVNLSFVKAKSGKVVIVKSNNTIKLPEGIEDVTAFIEFMRLYEKDPVEAKKISLKNLLTLNTDYK